MPLWLSGRSLLRSSPQCGLGRSADRGRITASKGALTSTLLNAKMRNGTLYGLVDLADTRTRRHMKCSIWDRASELKLSGSTKYDVVRRQVERCVNRSNGCRFNSQGTHILRKKNVSCILLDCIRKSLWIKASAKCINKNLTYATLFLW